MPTIKTSAAARKAQLASNLNTVALTAMHESQSQQAAIEAVKATLGKVRPDSDKPADKALFNTTRHTYQAGRMAFSLFGLSNAPNTDKLAKAQVARDAGNADGTGKLKEGQKRRTKTEQAAYDAARNAWSRLLKAAGLVTSDKRGGAVNAKKGAKASPVKGADKDQPKGATISAADAAKYVPPKAANPESATAFVRQQAAMLLAFVESANQRAMKASSSTLPVGICTAVADFKAAIDKIK